MTKIFRLPLIPLLIAYAFGLVSSQFNIPLLSQGPLILIILLFLWFLLLILKKVQWTSWIALVFFFVLGLVSIQSYLHPNLPPSHLSRFIGPEPIFLEGTIDRSPQRTSSGTQCLIKSHKIISNDRHIPVEGYLLLFLKGETDSLGSGDRIRFLCRLQRPHGFRNSGVFSYERYLAFERIHAIGFLSKQKGDVGENTT
ncbi:MAG: DUF4131 domain-containing protein [Deltaproteobacteria bacterium]|nr:DUF4131 domain-containing protein [Deltaproteobacteria bacterium]